MAKIRAGAGLIECDEEAEASGPKLTHYREIEVLADRRESRVSGGAGENERTELTQERRTAGGAMDRSRLKAGRGALARCAAGALRQAQGQE
jgi:hypothetical protein